VSEKEKEQAAQAAEIRRKIEELQEPEPSDAKEDESLNEFVERRMREDKAK
jgi:hypothetical protein